MKIKLTKSQKDILWNILYSVKHAIIDIDNGIDQIENLTIKDSGEECECENGTGIYKGLLDTSECSVHKPENKECEHSYFRLSDGTNMCGICGRNENDDRNKPKPPQVEDKLDSQVEKEYNNNNEKEINEKPAIQSMGRNERALLLYEISKLL